MKRALFVRCDIVEPASTFILGVPFVPIFWHNRFNEFSAPVTLNVVCFRYVAPDMDNYGLDELNKQIVIELQEQGVAVLSGTVVKGKYVLRAANSNHRSRREDFDVLVREVIRIGKELKAHRQP